MVIYVYNIMLKQGAFTSLLGEAVVPHQRQFWPAWSVHLEQWSMSGPHWARVVRSGWIDQAQPNTVVRECRE